MATVPIEIILQDAENPVEPTPTPGEETDIAVPETGIISNGNGGSNNGIGSAASIILPAILLVLAIGSIVAILIHKYRKQKKDKTSKKEKVAMATTSTIAVLAATVLIGNLAIPVTKAATSVEPGTAELDTVDKITITATREIDSDITIATVKNTSYATANLDFGYKVTASMTENATTANLYLNGDETGEYYIAPVSDGTLADNTWGYTLEKPSEDTTYLPIPLVDTPATITKGNDMVEDEAVDIYYSIKVDKDMPAGTYTGELEYTLTDNNFPSTLTTMQGMTTEICENTYTPGNQVTDPVPTATLEDTRDHKTYTIAKLADGKCWMTQNLDLDLSTEVTLTPADTNIANNWTPERKTIEPDDLAYGVWMNDAFHPYSYDPGNIYYYTSGTDADDIKYNSLAECETAGHTDCSHYHAGNYYNWSAAVASNDTSDISAQYQKAPGSICPSAWRLPLGPNLDDTSYSEITSLLEKYDTILGDFQPDIPGYYYLQDGFRRIRISPFWYNRPGQIVYGNLSSPTRSGFYFGGTVGNTSYSEKNISDSSFGRSEFRIEDNNRDYGHLIRCVAE